MLHPPGKFSADAFAWSAESLEKQRNEGDMDGRTAALKVA